jgi:hypothetical protein
MLVLADATDPVPHHGRGSQEGIIGELKSAMNLDHVPCRKRMANETFPFSGEYAHNWLRALQMQTTLPSQGFTDPFTYK